jgi:hypothetical protein
MVWKSGMDAGSLQTQKPARTSAADFSWPPQTVCSNRAGVYPISDFVTSL